MFVLLNMSMCMFMYVELYRYTYVRVLLLYTSSAVAVARAETVGRVALKRSGEKRRRDSGQLRACCGQLEQVVSGKRLHQWEIRGYKWQPVKPQYSSPNRSTFNVRLATTQVGHPIISAHFFRSGAELSRGFCQVGVENVERPQCASHFSHF